MLARTKVSNSFKIVLRYFSESQGSVSSSASSPSTPIQTNVPGLSAAVIHPSNEPLGPGVDPNKNGAYKVPEYFCYDNMSYFEAEIEMAKYRLPQPSALKK